MTLPVSFELPYPPSVNTYWRRVGVRTIVSKKGRQYREAVKASIQMDELKLGINFNVAVSVEVYPPDARRRDVDNILKALLDALRDAGVYKDDSLVKYLEVLMREPLRPEGLVSVTIRELGRR